MNSLARKPRTQIAKTTKAEVPDEIRVTAGLYKTANEIKNEHNALEGKFRKQLLGLMSAAGLKAITFQAEVGGTIKEDKEGNYSLKGGSLQTLTAVISAPKGNTVDIEKLSAKVDMATLLKIVSATQKAVKEHVSASVLAACLVETTGEDNVSVDYADKKK